MLRRGYLAGITDIHWTLIKDFHINAMSSIQWAGQTSQPFLVNQGVRNGGILSTGLYKLYINPQLIRLEDTGIGCRNGNICSNNTACADDIALIGTDTVDTQILVNMASDYAFMEGYQLQSAKSVAIKITSNPKSSKKLKLQHHSLDWGTRNCHL